jgi:predicted nucleotidyltransferase
MFCGEIFTQLQKNKVKYLVVGGVAVNLYGFARLTGDLDIMLLLKDANIKKFLAVAKRLGFKPKIPVPIDDFADEEKRRAWIEKKKMLAFCIYNKNNPDEVIDVLIDGCGDFEKAYNKKEIMKSGLFKIPVVCLDDLIALKRKANRERDKIDIRVLEQIRGMRHGTKK